MVDADTARVAPGLDIVDRWWRAANYLSVGQIYLLDNPLLAEPLAIEHVKPRLLGHWGTTPGLNLLWAHVNRLIVARDLSALFVCGPGHGGPAAIANPWLEGTSGELEPELDWSVDGMRRLFRRFSFPGGVPSHAAPETPGSIHEGGELGYALAHAYGAAFDAPDELVVCVVGDGEAETATLAASWHSHRFLNPASDGTVLPVLHLNGWKIANPTLLARLPPTTLENLFRGYGHEPWIVEGDEPGAVHEALARALDEIADRHAEIHDAARRHGRIENVVWPMLILRTPKGWTGPATIDGEPVEGHFRSHQVPLGHGLGAARLVDELERWLRSYAPDALFTADGAPIEALAALRPSGARRMSANPRTNGGRLVEPLALPPLERHAVSVGGDSAGDDAGETAVSATAVAGRWLRDVIDANRERFLLFGPDEVASNRLSAVFEVTGRRWLLGRHPDDVHLDPDGRVVEVLSENLCQGWLEGYLLSGRHGMFTSYEAFIHVVDSMFNQHAKWLESSARVPWREPLPALTYLLSSHVWRQDHNGFSHQDPGFLDVAANKRAEAVRIYLPPDANSLLATLDHCLRERHRINVVVAGKQPEPQYLDLDEARAHLTAGLGTWHWAGTERERGAPDVVLVCAGDVPTMETVAAAELLREHTALSVRVVNVVDLMSLQSPDAHPHGLPDEEYDRHVPAGVPTIFAFHGYPQLIHRFCYKRANHDELHVHGYVEEGTTTTPFDMAVLNGIDRFHLAIDAIERRGASGTADRDDASADALGHFRSRLDAHHRHIRETGDELPEIRDWTFARPASGRSDPAVRPEGQPERHLGRQGGNEPVDPSGERP